MAGFKAVVVIVLVIALAVGIAFGASRYLVSKLDGTGNPPPEQVGEGAYRYASEDGYSFLYPATYELSSQSMGDMDAIVFLPKGYVPPEAGEGPPTISVAAFPISEGTTLRQWLASEPRSNWQLIVDDRATRATTVDGEEAIWYHYSGLYENDAVAVIHNNRVIIFTVGYLDPSDQIRTDFNILIENVELD
ncbi:hypothetical protein IT396_00590 [Candidatus Nomurabacteria bacterium]|nr:hypothetical protein [Candidatus Nomurabacteria bacterium]